MTRYIDMKYGGRWEVLQEFARIRDTAHGKEVTMTAQIRNVKSGQIIEMPISEIEMLSRMELPPGTGPLEWGPSGLKETGGGDFIKALTVGSLYRKKKEKPEGESA